MARRVSLLGRITRIALRKGIGEGSRPWLVTGIAAITVRVVHRLGRQGPDTVFSEELHAGERVEIRLLPPESR
jgi:hypothetical protein